MRGNARVLAPKPVKSKKHYQVKDKHLQKGLYNPSYRPPRASENFTIDINAARLGQDTRTTVMLKNIPNSYSQDDILRIISDDFENQFDYLYLPIDFKFQLNVGYCFVNLDRPKTVARFVMLFKGVEWEGSKKVADVTYARTQGRKALLAAARNSKVSKTQHDPRLKPVVLPRCK